jgi:hypothetical protein
VAFSLLRRNHVVHSARASLTNKNKYHSLLDFAARQCSSQEIQIPFFIGIFRLTTTPLLGIVFNLFIFK